MKRFPAFVLATVALLPVTLFLLPLPALAEGTLTRASLLPPALAEGDIDPGELTSPATGSVALTRNLATARPESLPAAPRQLLADLDQAKPGEENRATVRAALDSLQRLQDSYTRTGNLDVAMAVRDGIQAFKARMAGARPDPGNLTSFRDLVGQSMYFYVTGRRTGQVWGSGIYTDDSDLGAVAVHAGLLQVGQKGIVKVTIMGGLEHYEGSEQNGVTSSPWESWDGSYVVQAGNPLDAAPGDALPKAAGDLLDALGQTHADAEGLGRIRAGLDRLQQMQDASARAGKLDEAVAIRDNVAAFKARLVGAQPEPESLTQFRGQVGRTFLFEVTGSTAGSVWGSQVYTDDSDLGTVAVHAGLLRDGQNGIIKVTILPGFERYEGSTRSGVTSSPYENWDGSYIVEAVNPFQ
jgi:hypothetical protein